MNKEAAIMYKLYTLVDFAQEDAIIVSDKETQVTIVLQDYSDEKYEKFSEALEAWELLFIESDWDQVGIGTDNYHCIDEKDTKRLPLKPDNLLIKNEEVVGFTLGKKHYPQWETPDDTVLMFLDGTSVGKVKHETSWIWGDYPSDTTVYSRYYTYILVKKDSSD